MPDFLQRSRRLRRDAAAGVVLVLAACAVPPAAPPNPFVGTWATAEEEIVTIRADTVVQRAPDGRMTALDRGTCGGLFRFSYMSRDRQALTALLPRQPELQKKLSDLLPAPSYPVAELDCDRGDQTYVLLNDRRLVAIYRDGDIGAVEQMARR